MPVTAPNDEYLTLPCIPFAKFKSKTALSNASGGNFDMKENGARRIIKLNPVWDKFGCGPGFTRPLKETIGSCKQRRSERRPSAGSEAFFHFRMCWSYLICIAKQKVHFRLMCVAQKRPYDMLFFFSCLEMSLRTTLDDTWLDTFRISNALIELIRSKICHFYPYKRWQPFQSLCIRVSPQLPPQNQTSVEKECSSQYLNGSIRFLSGTSLL